MKSRIAIAIFLMAGIAAFFSEQVEALGSPSVETIYSRADAGDFFYKKLGIIDGKYLFIYETPEDGRELWVCDGTAEGTHILKDLVPGPESGIREVLQYHTAPLENGLMYFGSEAGNEEVDFGANLWCTDGTETGTLYGAADGSGC